MKVISPLPLSVPASPVGPNDSHIIIWVSSLLTRALKQSLPVSGVAGLRGQGKRSRKGVNKLKVVTKMATDSQRLIPRNVIRNHSISGKIGRWGEGGQFFCQLLFVPCPSLVKLNCPTLQTVSHLPPPAQVAAGCCWADWSLQLPQT